MRFNEYGMPVVTEEEKRNIACLSPLLRAQCRYRPQTGPKGANEMWSRRCAREIEEVFPICTGCWIMQRLALGQKQDPPPDYCEVRCYTAERARESYAVLPTAIRSLETLWAEQRDQKYSDSDYTRAYYTSPMYLVWEGLDSKQTIALYPWKFLRETEEAAQWKAMQCPYLTARKPDSLPNW